MHDFDDEQPTQKIPRETMRDIVFGEGHAPIGPSKPTRELRPTPVDHLFDLSDGVPDPVEHDATTEPHMMAVAS